MSSTQSNGSSNSLNDKYRLADFGENRNRPSVKQPARHVQPEIDLQKLFSHLPGDQDLSRATARRAFKEATLISRAPVQTLDFHTGLSSALESMELSLAVHALHFGQPASSEQVLGRGRITGPVSYLKLLLKEWRLRDIDAAPLLGFERDQASEANAILNGIRTLSGHDAKDRIRALLSINALLNDMFRDDDSKNQWLRCHHRSLYETPLSLMLSGSMEKLLIVRDFVKYIAGV